MTNGSLMQNIWSGRMELDLFGDKCSKREKKNKKHISTLKVETYFYKLSFVYSPIVSLSGSVNVFLLFS